MTQLANLFSNSFSITANTTGFSNTTDTIIITNANTYLTANDIVRYYVPTDNTAIGGLANDNAYYVTFSNTSSIAISDTPNGANIDITDSRTTSPGETHTLYKYANIMSISVVDGRLVTYSSTGYSNLINGSYGSIDLTMGSNSENSNAVSSYSNNATAVYAYSNSGTALVANTNTGIAFKATGNVEITGTTTTNGVISTSGIRINRITYISKNGLNSNFLLQNGRLFSTSGSTGYWSNYTTGRGTTGTNNFYGTENFKAINFPDETGTIVDVGGGHQRFAYALFDNGKLYTWGDNVQGQCGLGHTSVVAVPTLAATGVTAVYYHPSNGDYDNDNRLFIKKTDNYIYCCGYNGYGALGVGDTTNRNSFTQITSLGTTVSKVWNMGATYGSTYVQFANGNISACGYNGYGQLGDSSTTSRSSFVDVTANWSGGSGKTLVKVVGGYGYYSGGSSGWTGMLIDDGTTTTFKTCGGNSWSNLGDGSATDRSTPVTPNVGSGRIFDVAGFGGGPGTCYVLKEDGTLYTWGYNGYGQCADGTTTNRTTPYAATTGVTALLCDANSQRYYSYYSQGFISKSGVLYATGYNGSGQLGVGDTTNRTSFVKVLLPSNFYVTAIGDSNGGSSEKAFIAVGADGRMFAWGYNGYYNVGSWPGISVYTPVQINLPLGA